MKVINITDIRIMRSSAALAAQNMHSKMIEETENKYLHQFIIDNNLDKSLEDILFRGMFRRSQGNEK